MAISRIATRWGFVAALAVPLALIAGPAWAGGGHLDGQFGSGGVVSTATAADAGADYQNGLAVQRDGKVIVGGTSDMGADGGLQWRVSRYTRAGALDLTFGSDGTVLANMSGLGGFDERLIALAVQHDGKVVAAGYVRNGPDTQDSALARFNPDGTLDATFGDGGKVITDIKPAPQFDFINQVLIDPSGNIVVGGGCQAMFVARYTPDGALDPSFNSGGSRPGINITETSAEGSAEILGMALDRQGRIVGGGYSFTPEAGVNSVLVRYLGDGTLDTSFNPGGRQPGVVVTDAAPDNDWDVVFRVAVDGHDRIVTVGDAFVGVGAGLYDIALVRYLTDGTLDGSFGTGGIVLTNAGPGDSDDDAQGLAILPNGDIMVGGSAAPTAFTFDSDFMIARFRPDGRLDRGFGSDGIAITPTAPGNADDEIWAMALDNGSRLVAAGGCDQPTTGRDVCVVRYHLAGNEAN